MTTVPWGDADLTADDRRVYRHPCRCSHCWPGQGVPYVPAVVPEPIPARSRIGTAIAVVFALAFIAGGVTAGLSTDTINGARLGALLLIALGGALLIRLAVVIRRRP